MELDEKEIGETLADWLVERRGLQPEMAKVLAKDLAESWGKGVAQTAVDVTAPELAEPAPPAGEPPVAKQAKVLDRVARFFFRRAGSDFQARQSG